MHERRGRGASPRDRPRPAPFPRALYPVGRLDVESSGLLLLTNDGELANRLTHPRYGVHKTYEVTVEGDLDENAVRKLQSGVFITERRGVGHRPPVSKTKRSSLTLLRSGRGRTRLLMELREGRNRQVRRMMLYVGHKVRKLRRIQFGPLKLKGLGPGQWRELTPHELAALRRGPSRPDRLRSCRRATALIRRRRPAPVPLPLPIPR